MLKRKAFCEFGAYAVNVTDLSKIDVMPLRTAGDLGLPLPAPPGRVSIDFTKILTPQGQTEAGFDAALLDALGVELDGSNKLPAPIYPHTDGLNVLTVGPVFPPCPHVGGILYERTAFYNDVRGVLDPNRIEWPAFDLHAWQIMTTATFDTNTQQLTRYHGFHATVKGDNGAKKILEIEGTTVEVDLTDRTVSDDPAAIAPIIIDPDRASTVPAVALTSGSNAGEAGAVFLALSFAAANNLRQGKVPPGGGYAVATTASDPFAKSVFKLSLARSRRIDIKSGDLTSVRNDLIQKISMMGAFTENLDIIADAPGGLQVFGTQDLNALFDSDGTGQGELLARLIRSRFARCRLLGCYTALSTRSRKRMLRLAGLLGIPVLGTLRAISHSDFDKYSFKQFQVINNVLTTVLKSTEHMSPVEQFDTDTEEQLATGWYQEMWLRQFEQVPLELADVSQNIPGRALLFPSILLPREIASTQHISIAPEGRVVLETEANTKIPATVLASATLLQLDSRRYGPVYLNIAPNSTLRNDLLAYLALR